MPNCTNNSIDSANTSASMACMLVTGLNCSCILCITYLTVLGSNTCAYTTVDTTYKELKLYSSLGSLLLRKATSALTVCACAKRVVHCVEKICAKNLRTVFYYVIRFCYASEKGFCMVEKMRCEFISPTTYRSG
jgi:hypothetical protein